MHYALRCLVKLWPREFLFIYIPAFLDTGLAIGNVHERDPGPVRGAITTRSPDPTTRKGWPHQIVMWVLSRPTRTNQ